MRYIYNSRGYVHKPPGSCATPNCKRPCVVIMVAPDKLKEPSGYCSAHRYLPHEEAMEAEGYLFISADEYKTLMSVHST